MQKIINGVALFSGCVSLGLVVGGATLYLQKDNIVNNLKVQLINGVSESVKGMLPGLVDGAMPELPGATGGAIGAPAGGGVALPF
tara:strand:- start:1023 stop:1277 length:255 start_codon:yes stop_codon:yes gene_type:complete